MFSAFYCEKNRRRNVDMLQKQPKKTEKKEGKRYKDKHSSQKRTELLEKLNKN